MEKNTLLELRAKTGLIVENLWSDTITPMEVEKIYKKSNSLLKECKEGRTGNPLYSSESFKASKNTPQKIKLL